VPLLNEIVWCAAAYVTAILKFYVGDMTLFQRIFMVCFIISLRVLLYQSSLCLNDVNRIQ
jgi:hypothetical protein